MNLLPVLALFLVLTVAFVAAEAKAEPEAEPRAEPVALAEPVLPENSELKRATKPKGTTTMSPKDLFLMHAQQSTTRKRATRKPSSVRTTTTTTTTTTPAPETTTESVAVKTTAKSKGKSKAKPKPKGRAKPKPKAKQTKDQGKDSVEHGKQNKDQINNDKTQNCNKPNQKGNRKARAECKHGHQNSTTPIVDTSGNEQVTATTPTAANPAADSASPVTADAVKTLTTAALVPERSDESNMEMAANKPIPIAALVDNPAATITLLDNGTLKEVRTKADLIALDSINGTNNDGYVQPK